MSPEITITIKIATTAAGDVVSTIETSGSEQVMTVPSVDAPSGTGEAGIPTPPTIEAHATGAEAIPPPPEIEPAAELEGMTDVTEVDVPAPPEVDDATEFGDSEGLGTANVPPPP